MTDSADAAQGNFPDRNIRLSMNISCDLDICSPESQCKYCMEFEKKIAPMFAGLLEAARSLSGTESNIKTTQYKGWPKPETHPGKDPKPIHPKDIRDGIVKELMGLDTKDDATKLFSRLIDQVWGGAGSDIQRLRGNIEYEIGLMQDKNQGEKILGWFNLYEKGDK